MPDKTAAAMETSDGLLHLSLRFDPYSATAEEDYERLKVEIRKFDIIGILKEELAKSRVHTALARKVISAVRFLDNSAMNDAVLSILDNCDVLYPIFSSVLVTISDVFQDIYETTKPLVIDKIVKMIKSDSHVLRVDVHLSYAIRVLAERRTEETSILLQQLYDRRPSALIRRDIILVMAQWREWYWLSDLKNRFRTLGGPERRAFIVASYILTDEGGHWRDHIRKELSPFERFVLRWAGAKASHPDWKIPL